MEFVFIALKIEIVLLLSCNKDIESHKSTCKFTGPEDEVGLIFCRFSFLGPSYMVSGTRDNPPPELPWPR